MPETTEIMSLEDLQAIAKDEAEFTAFFKKKAVELQLGNGSWIQDGKRGWRLNLPDGSYVRLKFFDTVKKIFNIKTNVEVPGRESYLSYINVCVMPKGVKGYDFITDNAQHVWGYAQSKALIGHQASLVKLRTKAAAFGIDLDQNEAWETYYAGKR